VSTTWTGLHSNSRQGNARFLIHIYYFYLPLCVSGITVSALVDLDEICHIWDDDMPFQMHCMFRNPQSDRTMSAYKMCLKTDQNGSKISDKIYNHLQQADSKHPISLF